MPTPNNDLIKIQVAPSALQPSVMETATDLVIPPKRMADRLRHFSPDVYDLSPESHLSRFLKVLMGDAGAGRLRKRLLVQRMRATLQGSHFYDLDRFYGPLFGLKRSLTELLPVNPYQGLATRDQWDDIQARDSSFRSRIEQFARAIPYGPTPTGMELIAEALLAVDCEINEAFVQADTPYVTYTDFEASYSTLANTNAMVSVEIDDTDWNVGANSTITSQVQDAYPDGFTVGGGIASLRVRSVAAGLMSADSDVITGIDDTEPYVFAAVLTQIDEDQDVHVEIDWYAAGSSFISTSTGANVSAVAGGGYFQVYVTANAPATAVEAVLRVVVNTTSAALVISRWDRLEFRLDTDMELIDYATLEGYGTSALLVDADRRTFIVRPKRHITRAEAYDLSKVLDKLKPADTRFIIDTKGVVLHEPLMVKGAYADSTHWEILQKIGALLNEANLPYNNISFVDPVEQPKPPFSGYQGEAWSYVTDLAGVTASYVDVSGVPQVAPPQRIDFYDGTAITFSAEQAILPSRQVQSGRSVSDAIMVAYPYDTNVGRKSLRLSDPKTDPTQKIYVDGVPLRELNAKLATINRTDPFQQNPESRFWVTQTRSVNDSTEEILEIRFNQQSWVNYVSFEMVNYPHILVCEVYDPDSGMWIERFRKVVDSSTPKILSPGTEVGLSGGHPQHSFPNHWQKVSERIDPIFTRRVRIRMQRFAGIPPYKKLHAATRQGALNPEKENVDYSLAIRRFDVGYRASDRSDFDFIAEDVIGQTIDPIGSQVTFEKMEHVPSRALDSDDTTAWRSEPQPVNYAVVNFYLDTRNEAGTDGQVIDRFFIDPTHAGPNFNIYYSNDADIPDGTTEFMEQRVWNPIPRSYTLQKGYVHIPTTRARFFKFEFTSLVPESYESFIPILRNTKLFPQQLVKDMLLGESHAVEAQLPGMTTATATATTLRYRDALQSLLESETNFGVSTETSGTTDYRPTESLWVNDLEGAARLEDKAWQFSFTPWHQGEGVYPKFNTVGQHFYEVVQVRHASKIGFFVGLRTIEAYRQKYEADENTDVYFDTYDDFRNLSLGLDWVFEPGYIHSEGTSPPVTATSRTFYSREPINAVQFATVQSDPVQLVPDHFFQSPELQTYTWDNTDSFQQIGDATLVYDGSDYSVIAHRYVVPIQKAIDRTGGLVQRIIKPIFGSRLFEVADAAAEAATFGGIRTPLMGMSERGRGYAAVRFTMLTDQDSPLILRVLDQTDSDAILGEKYLTGKQGELIEATLGFEIPDTVTVVYLTLTQEGKSDDSFRLHALSLFDEAMLWEFSNNGGGDWFPAVDIRNNENGILSFPALGNQLRYKVTGYRVNRWASAVKIRPHYVRYGNARPTGTHRGPNVSMYDHDVPINKDPLFTTWTKPVPYWWYAESRRFPLLSVEGASPPTEFSRFYGRPVDDDVSGLTDTAVGIRTIVRGVAEDLDNLSPTTDAATRGLVSSRDIEDDISATFSDTATAYIIIGESDPLNAPIPDDV